MLSRIISRPHVRLFEPCEFPLRNSPDLSEDDWVPSSYDNARATRSEVDTSSALHSSVSSTVDTTSLSRPFDFEQSPACGDPPTERRITDYFAPTTPSRVCAPQDSGDKTGCDAASPPSTPLSSVASFSTDASPTKRLRSPPIEKTISTTPPLEKRFFLPDGR